MKFLPANLNRLTKGFTMVELLVVVAIIAILAIVGVTVFGSAPSKARDAKRRGDIDAIAKALELKYNPETGEYPDPATLTGTDFAGGKKPTDPKKDGTGAVVPYKFTTTWSTDKTKFRVCADLEGEGTGWTGIETDYCTGSALGNAAAASGGQTCASVPSLPSGISGCRIYYTLAVNDIFIDCPAAGSQIATYLNNCSSSCVTWQPITYWKNQSKGTDSGTTGNYIAPSTCGGNAIVGKIYQVN